MFPRLPTTLISKDNLQRFSQLFAVCSGSAKFLLFFSILRHIHTKPYEARILVAELATELVSVAWYLSVHKGLSLGQNDSAERLAWNLVGNCIKKTQTAPAALMQVRQKVKASYDAGNCELLGVMSHVVHRSLRTFFVEEIQSLEEDEIEAMIYTLAYSLAKERQPLYSISTDISYITINECWIEILNSYHDDFVEWTLNELVLYIRQFNKGSQNQLCKEIQFLYDGYLKLNDKPKPNSSSASKQPADTLARIRSVSIMAQNELLMDVVLESQLNYLQQASGIEAQHCLQEHIEVEVLRKLTEQEKDKLLSAALHYLLELRDLTAVRREDRKERLLQLFAE